MKSNLNNPKVTRAWTMYDWANSVFSLTIATAIFPPYYESVSKAASIAQGNSPLAPYSLDILGYKIVNTAMYSYALSLGFLLVAFSSPILSGIADARKNKKFFMQLFCYLGSASCILMYFMTPETVYLGIILFILSLFGFGGSIVFYNAFLTEIVTEDKYDEVSARGFSMGYIGSVILLVINLIVIMKHNIIFPYHIKAFELNALGINMTDAIHQAKSYYEVLAIKLSFVMVGIWWAGFAQITFRNLHEDKTHVLKEEGNIFHKGFLEIKKVYHEILLPQNIRIRNYLLGYLFSSMGVQTVMYVASLFGSQELKMATSELILTILIIQIIAIGGAWMFSKISAKIGNIYSLLIMLVIWIGITIAAYNVNTSVQFYALAGVVGIVMGGIQSIFRSTFAKLIPDESNETASYFSFFDVCEKIAIVLGTLVYGLLIDITGNMRTSVLALMLFFLVGLFFVSRIKNFKGQTT
jgi:UMF1 family MFS transporter